jgi:hypothetical protein
LRNRRHARAGGHPDFSAHLLDPRFRGDDVTIP